MSTEAMKVSVDERVQTITNSLLFVGSYSGDKDVPARVTPEGIAMISDVVARMITDAETKVERDEAHRNAMNALATRTRVEKYSAQAHVYRDCVESAQCKACAQGSNESSEENMMESVLVDVDPTCHF